MMNQYFRPGDPWFYRLMFVSFFLPHKLQTVLFILFSGWVLFGAIQQKVSLTKRELSMGILFSAGYLFYVVYIPMTDPALRHLLFSLLERKVSLLVMPFVIPLALKLSRHSFRGEIRYFAYSNVVHGLLVNLCVLFKASADTQVNIDHVYYRIVFESFANIHPTYYGLYICFSLSVLLYDLPVRTLHPWVLRVFQILLLFYLLLLAPKISLLIAALLYAGHFIFVMQIRAARKMLFMLLSVVSIAISYIAIPFFQQRMNEVWRMLSGNPGNAVDNSLVFRQVILQTDVNLLKQSWLLGMGPARLQQNLDMAYLYLSGVSGVSVSSYNTHNEFLNQWICFGMAGILYFLIIFFVHLKRSIARGISRKTDHIYLLCTLMIMISCLTENVLSRQQGILFAALFLNLLYVEKQEASGIVQQ